MDEDTDELLTCVRRELLPVIASYGLAVVDREESTAVDYEGVVLQGQDVRVRILRDRGQVFVDFGSVCKPGVWFDSAVVMDFLGVSSDAGFHSSRVSEVLRGLVNFLRSFWTELSNVFSVAQYVKVERELTALRDTRAAKRLGF